MKAIIDERGDLHLERNGRMVKQYCPRITNNGTPSTQCGHWCPLFGEPHEGDSSGVTVLPLCEDAEWEFVAENGDELLDKR